MHFQILGTRTFKYKYIHASTDKYKYKNRHVQVQVHIQLLVEGGEDKWDTCYKGSVLPTIHNYRRPEFNDSETIIQ